MIKKGLKIVSILFFILFFTFSCVLATDINLNLPGTTTNDESVSSNETTGNTTVDNQTDENITDDSQVENETEEDIYDPYDDAETLTPNSVNSNSQGGLTVTDIINILLITVGVILVLLAIAIMIRLK